MVLVVGFRSNVGTLDDYRVSSHSVLCCVFHAALNCAMILRAIRWPALPLNIHAKCFDDRRASHPFQTLKDLPYYASLASH